MRSTTVLLLLTLVLGTAYLAAPRLGSDFRSEDYVDFAYYRDVSLGQCFTTPHLGTVLVPFYRPLGDALTWALVRLGPRPAAVHAVLLAIHVAACLAAFAAARRLLGMRTRAAVVVALAAACHPLVANDLLYLDGGAPQLLYGLFAMLSLWALGRWRDGEGGVLELLCLPSFALLSFDGALVFPLMLVVVALLLPAAVRRVPWWLILLPLPFLWLRQQVLGSPLGGYGLPLVPEAVVALGRGLADVFAKVWVPALSDFPGDAHAPAWKWAGFALLLGSAAAGVALSGTRAGTPGARESGGPWGRRLRKSLALLVLLLGFLAPSLDLLLSVGAGAPSFATLAYRLYPAALAVALAFGWIISRAGDRRWWGSLALAMPWIGLSLALGEPYRAGSEAAGAIARQVREDVAELWAGDLARRPVVLLATPLTAGVNARPMARVYQYGLSDSCRPPFLEDEVPVYPVFAWMREDGSVAEDAPLLTPPGGDPTPCVQRLLRTGWFLPLQFDATRGRVFPLPALPPDAAEDPWKGRLELLPPSGEQAPSGGDPAAQAADVPVSREGQINLFVRGEAAGTLRLVLFNRMHPYYVAEVPGLKLVRERHAGASADRLLAQAPHLREVARRFPGDRSFCLLQAIPDPAAVPGEPLPTVVSNVLVVRLREAGER